MQVFPDLAALLLGYFFYIRRAHGAWSVITKTLLYVYLSAVLLLTLCPVLTSLPHLFDHPYVPMHLAPFNDLVQHYGDAERQIVLNVLLFIPMGLLLPIVYKQGFFALLLKALCISLLIELLQPLLNGYRSSDITDVITNTVGAAVGFVLYLPWRPLLAKAKNKYCK